VKFQVIKRQFERNASSYAEHADAQREVIAKFQPFLQQAIQSTDTNDFDVLEIGVGSGLLTGELLTLLPNTRLTALDVSSNMLAEAERYLANHSTVSAASQKVRWMATDIMRFDSDTQFDLIASSSALHWLECLDTAFRKIKGLIKENGQFVFSLMTEGTLAELFSLKKSQFPGLDSGRALPSHQQVETALKQAGFRICNSSSFLLTERHENAISFFQSLSERGTCGTGVFTGAKPLMRKQLLSLAEAYQRSHSFSKPHDEAGVVASYHVSMFVAGI